MKSSKIKMTAVLLAAAFSLSGCKGALYEMTPEEEAAVVGYAAHAVAKFNNFQQDGQIFVTKDELESSGSSQEAVQPESKAPKQQEDESDSESAGQELIELGDETEPSSRPDSQPAAESQSTSTITEALDLGVIRADYKGSSLCTTYEKSDSFAVDASSGKQLLVLELALTNTSDRNLHIDILAMTPTFQVVVNETHSAMAQTTILPEDLSTYQGDIMAGATNEAVLMFEVPQEIQSVTKLELKITMDGAQHTITL